MPAPQEGLEQRVFEVFRTTQETLKGAKERFPDNKNPHNEGLAEDVAALDQDKLAYLLKTGRGAVAMGINASSWRDESLAIQLAGLARARYIEIQNQEVTRLLEDREITATILEGSPSGSITTPPSTDPSPVPSSVTGILHPDTSIEFGHLLMQPGDAEPDSPWKWNVHLLNRDGTQLVGIEIVGQEAPAPA